MDPPPPLTCANVSGLRGGDHARLTACRRRGRWSLMVRWFGMVRRSPRVGWSGVPWAVAAVVVVWLGGWWERPYHPGPGDGGESLLAPAAPLPLLAPAHGDGLAPCLALILGHGCLASCLLVVV